MSRAEIFLCIAPFAMLAAIYYFDYGMDLLVPMHPKYLEPAEPISYTRE